ncbi:MAG: hypothetical protein JST29_05630 [Bacteroidetes bacterium]|nr:hypothetical protein [Bacteroidota bacterium]
MQTLTHLSIDKAAFNELALPTKAVVYAACKSLYNEIERFWQNSDITQKLNSATLFTYHMQIRQSLLTAMSALEQLSAPEDLQLFNHFG